METEAAVDAKQIVEDYLHSINIDESRIKQFFKINRKPDIYEKMIRKVSDRYVGLPTIEEAEEYGKLPKNLSGLQRIKHPVLYGWTSEEIIQAIMPYIKDISARFRSKRCEMDDCEQNGMIGVMQAINTDAGISPFANHCYQRIKTSIRRQSAQSGIIKVPERTPSQTEIRRLITIFLSGKVIEHETNKLSVRGKVTEKRLNNRLRHFMVNSINYLNESELIECRVQKIGVKNASEILIRNDVKLKRFKSIQFGDTNVYDAMIQYITFNLALHRRELQTKDYSRLTEHLRCLQSMEYETVYDLVKYISTCPDFHQNPISINNDDSELTSTISSEQFGDPSEIFESDDHHQALKNIIVRMTTRLQLSEKQAEIYDKLYNKHIPSMHIATSLQISRQRVLQCIKNIKSKLSDIMWEELLDNPKLYKVIEAMRDEKLFTNDEDNVLVLLLGLDNCKVCEIEEIGKILSDSEDSCDIKMIEQRITKIKNKVLRYIWL